MNFPKIDNENIMAQWNCISLKYPFLTSQQVMNLFSYCGGMKGIESAINNVYSSNYRGMKLTRIPMIGLKTATKLLTKTQ